MGTYFKELDDRDEVTLLYNQVKMLLGFIYVVISSEYLYSFMSGAEGGVLYVTDFLALLAVGCILIREGLRQTLSLAEF
jgi:hypothetical protein